MTATKRRPVPPVGTLLPADRPLTKARDPLSSPILDGPKVWIFTFRRDAWLNGEPLVHRFVRRHGGYVDAMRDVQELFPDAWAYQYSGEVTAGVGALGLVELEVTA